MATGESFRSLSFGFCVYHRNISKIFQQTLAVLKTKLVPMSNPSTIDFKSKAPELSCKWNFPNCILAIMSNIYVYVVQAIRDLYLIFFFHSFTRYG